MNNRPYLHRKCNRLYFRRRIPRLSTLIAPVTLALGTTDAALGNIWIGYHNRSVDALQVIQEQLKLARDLREKPEDGLS